MTVKREIKDRLFHLPTSTSVDHEEATASKNICLRLTIGPEEQVGFSNFEEEIETYLHESHLEDCLNWWKENHICFPKLAILSRSLLSIPATSAPAERLFSNAGLTVNKLRACLNPKTVDSSKWE